MFKYSLSSYGVMIILYFLIQIFQKMYRRFIENFKLNGEKQESTSLPLSPISRSTVLTAAATDGGVIPLR